MYEPIPQFDEERYLIELIERFKTEYMRAAEPYAKRLAEIQMTRGTVFVRMEAASAIVLTDVYEPTKETHNEQL